MAIAMRQYVTERNASTYASCSALQFKPLDTAIGQIFAPYCPGDRQGPIQTSKTNASHSLAYLMAKAMCRYSAEDINKCAVLSASIEATGHRNRSNIRSVSPWWPPGSHTSKQKNTSKRQNKHPYGTCIAEPNKKDKCIVFCTSQGQTLLPK